MDPGPEQVGLGYRAISAVGVDRGHARALRSAAQMVTYEVSIGLVLIVHLVSAFGSTKERNGGNRSMGNVRVSSEGSFFLWVIRRVTLSDQGPGHKGLGTIQVRRTPEMTAMSRNLTYGPKQRENTRT
ncbi:hypothetical protein KY284_023933 [Solanum tuberosum]|nr:hypothetical protein KY284_023933 [Solanum tuberosum]